VSDTEDKRCPASISGTCLLLVQGFWHEGTNVLPCVDGCELQPEGKVEP